MREEAGAKGIEPPACRKTEKVGVLPAAILAATELAGVPRHPPVAGSVWHSVAVTGKAAPPVSAETISAPVVPTLALASAKAPVPPSGIAAMPLLVAVAVSATTSGTAVVDIERSTVSTPRTTGAGAMPPQAKLSARPGALNAAVP